MNSEPVVTIKDLRMKFGSKEVLKGIVLITFQSS